VFGQDCEVPILICINTALSCRFDHEIERAKSLPVTTQKSDPFGLAGETGAFEACGLSGEGILHASSLISPRTVKFSAREGNRKLSEVAHTLLPENQRAASIPPSTPRIWPLTKSLAREARKTAAPASSSG